MKSEKKRELEHQLERVNTFYKMQNRSFNADHDPTIIIKIIPGRYVRSNIGGMSGYLQFEDVGFTLQGAIQTKQGFIYEDVFFDTEEEALSARPALMDILKIKAST